LIHCTQSPLARSLGGMWRWPVTAWGEPRKKEGRMLAYACPCVSPRELHVRGGGGVVFCCRCAEDGFATCTALPRPFNRSTDDRPPPAAWRWDTPAVTECRMRRAHPMCVPAALSTRDRKGENGCSCEAARFCTSWCNRGIAGWLVGQGDTVGNSDMRLVFNGLDACDPTRGVVTSPR
jgi:hypothetical protein